MISGNGDLKHTLKVLSELLQSLSTIVDKQRRWIFSCGNCPPLNSPESNQSLIDYIGLFCTGRDVGVAVDFNLPTANWTAGPHSSLSLNNKKLLDGFSVGSL